MDQLLRFEGRARPEILLLGHTRKPGRLPRQLQQLRHGLSSWANYGPFTGDRVGIIVSEVRLADDFSGDVQPGMIVCATGQTYKVNLLAMVYTSA